MKLTPQSEIKIWITRNQTTTAKASKYFVGSSAPLAIPPSNRQGLFSNNFGIT
jgi:hypothetical protein